MYCRLVVHGISLYWLNIKASIICIVYKANWEVVYVIEDGHHNKVVLLNNLPLNEASL